LKYDFDDKGLISGQAARNNL
jgi:hypothetical protein